MAYNQNKMTQEKTNEEIKIFRDSIKFCKVCNMRTIHFYNFKNNRRDCIFSLDNVTEELKHKELLK